MFTDFPSQMNLFDAGWPDHERFPYNTSHFHVKSPVFQDLLASVDPLIITGYSSLGMLLNFFELSQQHEPPLQSIRLMLGHEPTPTTRQNFTLKNTKFTEQFESYWLEQGISLYKSAQVLLTIDLLQRHIIQVRIADDAFPLHAKIYKGDQAITLGSSNFSHLGLMQQTEANARFLRSVPLSPSTSKKTKQQEAEERGAHKEEQQRFQEASQLAELLWARGTDYTEQFLELLKKLLHTVTWQEALARACAEVLEGTWAQQYTKESPLREGPGLWPSQQQGIAQAMWVIEHVGSVLIADATGSGKTQMGAYLMRAVMHRIWSQGHRRRHDLPILISPASMVQEWERVGNDCGQPISVYSDGALSSHASEKHEDTERAVRRAQVLAVDEAHRYHNRRSERTKQLYNNLADHVLLFTATPVNRGPSDLLTIIDLLGADNFDDDVLAIFEHLGRGNHEKADEIISISERLTLQRAIQQFTVRRTKRMLNNMIDESPEKYQDIFSNPCRYPEHKAHFYPCGEKLQDRLLAQEIREKAQQLRGLFALTSPFFLSEAQRRDGIQEKDYIQWRLKGAQSLAIYNIMAKLRSSRAALLEHLSGTLVACQQFDLPLTSKSTPTGDIIQSLRKQAQILPENKLQTPLPSWLTDLNEHEQVIAREVALYEEIGRLVLKMSDDREQTKANLLLELQHEHALVLAFDTIVLSLIDLQQRLRHAHPHGEILLATGNDKQGRKKVKKLAQLGSTAKDVIALCSDAMSEGLNLQSASVVVHLDMPTVIRVAEQRVGRIDRMNSPHTTIASYWPEESDAFALRSDERFFSRHEFVAEYLGSNLTLPVSESKIITAHDIAEQQINRAAEDDENDWRQIPDAFEPVRLLIAGEQRLVRDTDIYEQIRKTNARVLSSVSIVSADHPWAFFAIAGTDWGAPRWVYLDGVQESLITNLQQICQLLRQQLEHKDTSQREFDSVAADWLTQFLDRLNKTERQLLPKKKQRALDEMGKVLNRYMAQAKLPEDHHRLEIIRQLLSLVDTPDRGISVDWSALAESWLDLIRPTWYDHLRQRHRATPLLLKDIRSALIAEPFSTDLLEEILQSRLWTRPLDQRIVAAILGIPMLHETGV